MAVTTHRRERGLRSSTATGVSHRAGKMGRRGRPSSARGSMDLRGSSSRRLRGATREAGGRDWSAPPPLYCLFAAFARASEEPPLPPPPLRQRARICNREPGTRVDISAVRRTALEGSASGHALPLRRARRVLRGHVHATEMAWQRGGGAGALQWFCRLTERRRRAGYTPGKTARKTAQALPRSFRSHPALLFTARACPEQAMHGPTSIAAQQPTPSAQQRGRPSVSAAAARPPLGRYRATIAKIPPCKSSQTGLVACPASPDRPVTTVRCCSTAGMHDAAWGDASPADKPPPPRVEVPAVALAPRFQAPPLLQLPVRAQLQSATPAPARSQQPRMRPCLAAECAPPPYVEPRAARSAPCSCVDAANRFRRRVRGAKAQFLSCAGAGRERAPVGGALPPLSRGAASLRRAALNRGGRGGRSCRCEFCPGSCLRPRAVEADAFPRWPRL
eukprot:366334-Chlamydomonas_euryale.AAC.5